MNRAAENKLLAEFGVVGIANDHLLERPLEGGCAAVNERVFLHQLELGAGDCQNLIPPQRTGVLISPQQPRDVERNIVLRDGTSSRLHILKYSIKLAPTGRCRDSQYIVSPDCVAGEIETSVEAPLVRFFRPLALL